MKLVYWLAMGGLLGGLLLHLVQRERDCPPSPFLAVPNVTAHPSTVIIPITALLMLCAFNVAIKGLTRKQAA